MTDPTMIDPLRRLTAGDYERMARDVRTSLRAIEIYTDLIRRDIGSRRKDVSGMQEYCDGINATVIDLGGRLEQLRP